MGFESIINNAPEFNAGILPTERQYRPDLAKSRILAASMVGIIALSILTSVVSVFWPLASTWYLYLLFFAAVLYMVSVETSNAVESARLASYARSYMHPGQIQKATEQLDRACGLARRNAFLMSYAVYYRAHAYVLSGNPLKALPLFAANYYSRAPLHKHSSVPFFWSLSISQMARCHALVGAIPEAEKWQAFAHANADELWNGPLVLTDAIIAARMGRMDIVLKDLQGRWPEIEGSLEVWEQRALKLLIAFGLAQTNSGASKDAEIQQWIAALHPQQPGEFNYLAASWPELQNFLQQRSL